MSLIGRMLEDTDEEGTGFKRIDPEAAFIREEF
jgi:hypothetical protein